MLYNDIDPNRTAESYPFPHGECYPSILSLKVLNSKSYRNTLSDWGTFIRQTIGYRNCTIHSRLIWTSVGLREKECHGHFIVEKSGGIPRWLAWKQKWQIIRWLIAWIDSYSSTLKHRASLVLVLRNAVYSVYRQSVGSYNSHFNYDKNKHCEQADKL